ncbi:MAG TPA: chorismate synthase [Elusimicrobiota bacterium]|nr:chorismate synthase [Elusimicrobiota bacterium]
MIRYLTAGESHGPCLTAVLEGVPAGLKITEDYLNQELHRRQYSFGRGERLQYIEKDTVKILSGVRWGETLGSPIAFRIENRDWENWEKIMSVDAADKAEKFRLTRPRPGHADLVGVLKYDRQDTRDILERASARETAARTAVGSVCKRLLEELGVKIYSWVVEIGGVVAKTDGLSIEESFSLAEKSPVRCPDKAAEEKMVEAIKEAKTNGDTLGGVYTVVVTGCPVGLGSHTHWDRKLDGKLAQAILSIQAHKGVEIGHGFGLARSKGSEVHDELFYQAGRGFYRKSNNAGGIEGGMTNGEPIVVRAAVKPLASLRRPLKSVNIQTKEEMTAEIVRSDVCPVASAAVVGETVVAIALAEAVSEKFGSDSIREMRDHRDRYTAHLLDY